MAVNSVFQRISLLTGPRASAALEKSRVIVVGLGGVGSWCAEALVRSGIGSISLVDSDRVSLTNINRQVQASGSTVGRLKTEALEERLKDINSSCEITSFPLVFSKETAALFDISGADYIIDAIDTLGFKLDLIEASLAAETKLYSSMGMAQKLDPTLIRTADIWETRGCALARLVRQGLRKRNISEHFTAVYSPESAVGRASPPVWLPQPEEASAVCGRDSSEKLVLGSAVTVTASAGMVLASLVIRDACAQ